MSHIKRRISAGYILRILVTSNAFALLNVVWRLPGTCAHGEDTRVANGSESIQPEKLENVHGDSRLEGVTRRARMYPTFVYKYSSKFVWSQSGNCGNPLS